MLKGVKLAIEPGRVVLTVRNMEAGQGVEELEVDYDGEPFVAGLWAARRRVGGDKLDGVVLARPGLVYRAT